MKQKVFRIRCRRIILVTINVSPASTSIYLPQLVHKFSTGFGVTFFHRCFGNSRLNPVTEAKRFERKRKRQEIRAYSVPRSSVFLFVFHLLSVIELPSSHFHASVFRSSAPWFPHIYATIGCHGWTQISPENAFYRKRKTLTVGIFFSLVLLPFFFSISPLTTSQRKSPHSKADFVFTRMVLL